MKQTLLLSIILLYSSISIAQKTISKEDFEYLVDYANCKYVMTFIEKNDVGKPYYNDFYKGKIEPELRKVSLDNFELILSYHELKKLLVNNLPALSLVDEINKKKNAFDNAESDKTLIESLKVIKWKNNDLITISDEVLNECFKKYGINEKITSQNNIYNKTDQTESQLEENKSERFQLQLQNENLMNDAKIIDYQKSFNIFRIIVFSAFAMLFIAIIVIGLFYKGKLREYVIKQVIDSKRIEEKFTPKNNYQSSNGMKTYNLTEKDINLIVDRVLECMLLNEKENQKQSSIKDKFSADLLKPTTKYLKGKSGKIFSRIEHTPENSFFKLLKENDDDAQFEFCGDESEAIAKRIFSEDICNIISGNYQNANSVKTHKPGKIKRIGEQWVVIESIEIKLI